VLNLRTPSSTWKLPRTLDQAFVNSVDQALY
jgi:hypothetical protein